ncbi:MAG: hypothetical protein MJK04_10090, partial [Psychrosphaera sp.]|nr:hypothetical protein [Psychrosphaera sp.]
MNIDNLITPPQPVIAPLAYRFFYFLLISVLIGSFFAANTAKADHDSGPDSIENAIALRQHDRLSDA